MRQVGGRQTGAHLAEGLPKSEVVVSQQTSGMAWKGCHLCRSDAIEFVGFRLVMRSSVEQNCVLCQGSSGL